MQKIINRLLLKQQEQQNSGNELLIRSTRTEVNLGSGMLIIEAKKLVSLNSHGQDCRIQLKYTPTPW